MLISHYRRHQNRYNVKQSPVWSNKAMKVFSTAVMLCLAALMPWPEKLDYLFDRDE